MYAGLTIETLAEYIASRKETETSESSSKTSKPGLRVTADFDYRKIRWMKDGDLWVAFYPLPDGSLLKAEYERKKYKARELIGLYLKDLYYEWRDNDN